MSPDYTNDTTLTAPTITWAVVEPASDNVGCPATSIEVKTLSASVTPGANPTSATMTQTDQPFMFETPS